MRLLPLRRFFGKRFSAAGAPPKWLSTHPTNEDRIKDIQVYAQKVMPLYTAAKAGPSAGK